MLSSALDSVIKIKYDFLFFILWGGRENKYAGPAMSTVVSGVGVR